MFRVNKNLISGLLCVLAISVAACNNVSGPTGPIAGSPSDSPNREPQVFDKVCIDDLRALVITNPTESRIVHVGDFIMVAWDAQHVCGQFEAQVEVSYGAAPFELIGEKKNALSMAWRVADREGLGVRLRVTVTDVLGTLTETVGLAGTVQRRPGDNGPRIPPVYD